MSNVYRIIAMSAIGTALIVLIVLMAGCCPGDDLKKVEKSEPFPKWEEINSPNGYYGFCRTRIPEGWLVLVKGSNGSGAAAIISDPNHFWNPDD